jgi:hypothetical protein
MSPSAPRFGAKLALATGLALAVVSGGCAERKTGSVCTAGAERCSENLYEVCAGDGEQWLVAADCVSRGQLCFTGVGCRVCAPGSRQCGGDGFDIVRCNAAGDGFDAIGRCDPDTGQLCAGVGECKNACDELAANRSYEGCEYWAVDLDNAVTSDQGPAAAQQYSLVVTNPLELPASIKVEVNDAPPGLPPQIRTVASARLERVIGGGDLAIINLDAREVDCSSDPRKNDGTGTCISNAAFHIVSTAPIVAYQFNPLENVSVYSNDASLLLPQSALDENYLVMGWPQTLANTNDGATNAGIDLRAFLTIVGTKDATTVKVELSTDIVGGAGIPAAKAGDVLDLALGAYEVINLETGGFNADFTGTGVYADKPVAVFSGSEASDVPYFDSFAFRDCCADHLEEQLFPESSFGTSFVGTKSPRRTAALEQGGWNVAVVDAEPEWWRVLAAREDTKVRTNLPPPDDGFTLQRGASRTFKTTRDFVLSASDPVALAQFQGSQQTVGLPSSVPGGDPSMAMVPPVQQFRSKYVFLVPNKYLFDYLLISFPVGTELLYDGILLENAIPGCEYASAGPLIDGATMIEWASVRCPLSSPRMMDAQNPAWQDDGRHTLESVAGQKFGLVVYGWDRFVSYAYPGGSNVDLINPK